MNSSMTYEKKRFIKRIHKIIAQSTTSKQWLGKAKLCGQENLNYHSCGQEKLNRYLSGQEKLKKIEKWLVFPNHNKFRFS